MIRCRAVLSPDDASFQWASKSTCLCFMGPRGHIWKGLVHKGRHCMPVDSLQSLEITFFVKLHQQHLVLGYSQEHVARKAIQYDSMIFSLSGYWQDRLGCGVSSLCRSSRKTLFVPDPRGFDIDWEEIAGCYQGHPKAR